MKALEKPRVLVMRRPALVDIAIPMILASMPHRSKVKQTKQMKSCLNFHDRLGEYFQKNPSVTAVSMEEAGQITGCGTSSVARYIRALGAVFGVYRQGSMYSTGPIVTKNTADLKSIEQMRQLFELLINNDPAMVAEQYVRAGYQFGLPLYLHKSELKQEADNRQVFEKEILAPEVVAADLYRTLVDKGVTFEIEGENFIADMSRLHDDEWFRYAPQIRMVRDEFHDVVKANVIEDIPVTDLDEPEHILPEGEEPIHLTFSAVAGKTVVIHFEE